VKVVQLEERRHKETRDTVQRLNELTQRGEIIGVAVCYLKRNGKEMVLCTGPFRRPGVASRAGFLMQMEDLIHATAHG
jgi:hypothetical protein